MFTRVNDRVKPSLDRRAPSKSQLHREIGFGRDACGDDAIGPPASRDGTHSHQRHNRLCVARRRLLRLEILSSGTLVRGGPGLIRRILRY
jgi:hypothetical protein